MTAPSKACWAPIHKTAKGVEWINWHYIRETKTEAKRALLNDVLVPKNILASTRFAKVVVSEVDQ